MKYLNEEGLQKVADNVNTRLKTVSEMPVTASPGAIRLYVGENTANYKRGHTYQWKDATVGDVYYAWVDIEGPWYIYTKTATPDSESTIYWNEDNHGQPVTDKAPVPVIGVDIYIASYDSSTNRITDSEGYIYEYDPEYNYDENIPAGWKDLAGDTENIILSDKLLDGLSDKSVILYIGEDRDEDMLKLLKGHFYEFTTNGNDNLYAYTYDTYSHLYCKDKEPTSDSVLYNASGEPYTNYVSKTYSDDSFYIIIEGGSERRYGRNPEQDIINNWWTDITARIGTVVSNVLPSVASFGESILYTGETPWNGYPVNGHTYVCDGSALYYGWSREHHPGYFAYTYTTMENPQVGDHTTSGGEIKEVYTDGSGNVERIKVGNYDYYNREPSKDYLNADWQDVTPLEFFEVNITESSGTYLLDKQPTDFHEAYTNGKRIIAKFGNMVTTNIIADDNNNDYRFSFINIEYDSVNNMNFIVTTQVHCTASSSYSNWNLIEASTSEVPMEDVYSTSETRTSKVYDGKPVYRKCYNGNIMLGTMTYIDVTDVETPVWCHCHFIENDAVVSSIEGVTPRFSFANNELSFVVSNTVGNKTGAAVMEYTKTTD